jgi:hypothetical protein
MVAKAAERQHPSSRRIATFARLQCTFEAATVAERHLRVHIAGVGLSASQRYLMRFGPSAVGCLRCRACDRRPGCAC